jgi:hypothetical protein
MTEPMVYHISVSVRDMLSRGDSFLCDLYRCEPAQIAEIRAKLVIAQAMGHAYIPLNGECDNFDPASGCRGHTDTRAAHFLRYWS